MQQVLMLDLATPSEPPASAAKAARKRCQATLRRQGQTAARIQLRWVKRDLAEGPRMVVECRRGRAVLRWCRAPACPPALVDQDARDAEAWAALSKGWPCSRCKALKARKHASCAECERSPPLRTRPVPRSRRGALGTVLLLGLAVSGG